MRPPVPGGGEVLKLGPPASGEFIVTVDARQAPSPFTAGTQTLLPRAEIPVHRARDWDEVWVVLKGQGCVTLGERVSTVVHGAVLSVPRQTWFGLRNTGNGPLQAVVVSAPAGVDGLFRELSQLGASPSPAAVQEAAQRYGVEFRPPGGTEPVQAAGRGRRRRGGKRRGQPRAAAQPQPPSPTSPPALPAAQPVQAGATPVQPQPTGQGGRRRRRHRRGRGGGAGQKAAVTSAAAPQPQARKPQPSKPQPSGPGRSKRREAHRRSGRVKEVYMGGKWVQVSGEGPVIASGESGGGRHHQVDDDGPGGPLSVPL